MPRYPLNFPPNTSRSVRERKMWSGSVPTYRILQLRTWCLSLTSLRYPWTWWWLCGVGAVNFLCSSLRQGVDRPLLLRHVEWVFWVCKKLVDVGGYGCSGRRVGISFCNRCDGFGRAQRDRSMQWRTNSGKLIPYALRLTAVFSICCLLENLIIMRQYVLNFSRKSELWLDRRQRLDTNKR